MLRKTAPLLLLLLITCAGSVLRLVNTSLFLFYPDAYQNLIVAQNIQHFHSVIGRLGNDGMMYPDFIAWTRPGYALLINVLSIFVHNELLAARIIANIFSITSIPVCYFFIKNVFRSKKIGLWGSFLLAISFTHIIWTGFIQTEAVSIFLVMLIFTLLFHNFPSRYAFGNAKDFIIGVVLGYAVLTRYEYILLVIPLGYILWKTSPNFRERSITILSSFLFVLAGIVSLFFPIQYIIRIFYQQTSPIAIKLLLLTCIFITFIILAQKLALMRVFKYLDRSVILGFVLVCEITYIVLPIFFPWINIAVGFRNFLLHDFFLNICFLVGLYFLLRTEKKLVIFVIVGIIFLGGAYIGINPSIERYSSHLLPFFLIPASYGLSLLVKFVLHSDNYLKKVLSGGLIIVCVLVQLYFSFFGIQKWGMGEWFKTSYEEESAKKIATLYKAQDGILLVSFPEPYYFFSAISTYSITDAYPYIYIPPTTSSEIILVKDRGMTYLFPHFVTQVVSKLEKYKRTSFNIDRPFHYASISENPTQPVVVYVIPIPVLKQTIVTAHSNTYRENTRYNE